MAYPQRRTLRLEAPRSWQTLNLAELWEYRELLFFFVWRDVKVRYKQTVLGALWAIIQPLTTTFAFAILFGRLGGMSQHVDGPYALHVFAGMLPWTFFANAVTVAANSLVGSGHLISKVYFPRLLVPLAAIASGLIDFAISFVVLLIMMAIYGVAPTPSILAAPLFLAGTIIASAGVGILLRGAGRDLSRRPLHHHLRDAAVAVRLAGVVLDRDDPGALAPALCDQPDGRPRSPASAPALSAGRRRPM